MSRRLALTLSGSTAALLVGLVLAPAASAATPGSSVMPLGFLGFPSLHSIIEAIAKGFFSALAGALVPTWLKHGTIATIQHLVALPDPASWTHVGELQSDMVYLGAMLLPATLALSTVRYWLMGFTGAAHPMGALGRCVWVTFVLVAYRWFVEEAVAATNTLTHAILGFPVVAAGLQRIIGVLFGSALLVGAGGVFGAFLVIVGVIFAAALFALQVLLTVVLAVLIVVGPPLIALSAIPELSHLARTWAHALLAVTLVPLGWTVLFAVAGALCLDATSFTGGAGGVPGHVAAAFAGLITFVLAVRLPLMLLGELRNLLGASALSGQGGGGSGQGTMPGGERVRAAHARLRSAALEGVPSLGRSAGRAAGALGAPAGGPVGAARRGLAGAARRSGVLSGGAAGAAGGAVAGAAAGRVAGKGARRGVRERLAGARAIIASAPREARAAMAGGSRKGRRVAARAAGPSAARGASSATGDKAARVSTGTQRARGSGGVSGDKPRASQGSSEGRAASRPQARPASKPAAPLTRAPKSVSGAAGGGHPGRKVTTDARREAAAPARPPAGPSGQGASRARPREQRSKPPASSLPRAQGPRKGGKPPRSGS